MKKTIILLCVFLGQFYSYAQYKPMLEPGKVWTQHYNYWFGGLSDSVSMSGADSLINGISYYKLDGVLMPGDLLVPKIIGNPMLAREDTTEGKVWIFIDSIEYLLFDFSLMQGDTVIVYTNNSSSSMYCDSLQALYVTNVDTFVDLEGIPRKEIHLQLITHNVPWGCFNSTSVVWIEGIGSDKGFNLIADEGMFTYLLCAWKSGVQLFQGTAYVDTCWVGSTIGVEHFEHQSLQIYPNPATDVVIIRSGQYPIRSIAVYDLRGSVLQQYESLDVVEKSIDISRLQAGLYVFRLVDEAGDVVVKKLQVVR